MKKALAIVAVVATVGAMTITAPAQARGIGPGLAFGLAAGAIAAGVAGAYGPHYGYGPGDGYYGPRYYGPAYYGSGPYAYYGGPYYRHRYYRHSGALLRAFCEKTPIKVALSCIYPKNVPGFIPGVDHQAALA